jgi:DnaJ-domain-containing protein 1
MAGPTTNWVIDEQQVSFIKAVFDLVIHDPIDIALTDIDEPASLAIGQNRTEMSLDADTVEIIAMYMDDGMSIPMPLVFKPNMRAKKVIKIDGNHRIDAALVQRQEERCPAVLLTGETQVAQRLAVVINTVHGRSTRNAEYVATAMRALREQEVPLAQIARMFGVSESKVGIMTRRDRQADRIRSLVPERRSRVPMHTLDLVGQIEDAHVKILGDLFLDAPKKEQEEYTRKLRDTSSAQRDSVAHEIVGELREIERAKRKVKATQSRPSSMLMGALQRMMPVLDPTHAYYSSTDHQQAIMRSNLFIVMPRLTKLWTSINDVGREG